LGEFGLRRQAQRDAAFLRANQVASLAKIAWRTLLGDRESRDWRVGKRRRRSALPPQSK